MPEPYVSHVNDLVAERDSFRCEALSWRSQAEAARKSTLAWRHVAALLHKALLAMLDIHPILCIPEEQRPIGHLRTLTDEALAIYHDLAAQP
jgi:hypothetical protein